MNIPDETKLYEAVHRVLKSGSTIAIDDGVQGGIGPVLYPTPWARIIGILSTIGHVTMIGLYCSSKWAFEAIRESLVMEVKALGIKVSIVEPRAYATEFGGPASGKLAAGLHNYGDLKAQVFEGMKTMQRGDPKATPDAMFRLVDAENLLLRLFLGSHNLPQVRATYAERVAT